MSPNKLGMRIAVVGSTGSGKSTLASQLASQLDANHVELDALYWKPNWEEEEPNRFRQSVAKVAQQDSWILDGNYRRVRDLIWKRATTIIWLDYSMPVCLGRLLRRSVRRAWNQELLWGTNRESFRLTFFTRESVIRWLIESHPKVRCAIADDLASDAYAPLHSLRLKTPRQTEDFLSQLAQ